MKILECYNSPALLPFESLFSVSLVVRGLTAQQTRFVFFLPVGSNLYARLMLAVCPGLQSRGQIWFLSRWPWTSPLLSLRIIRRAVDLYAAQVTHVGVSAAVKGYYFAWIASFVRGISEQVAIAAARFWAKVYVWFQARAWLECCCSLPGSLEAACVWNPDPATREQPLRC